MFKNYFLTTLRNIRKHKVYSFINISGLAIGTGCTILITLYVRYELSYDKFHTNADTIYRVTYDQKSNSDGSLQSYANSNYPMADALRVDFPELENVVRLLYRPNQTVTANDNSFNDVIMFADEEFFEMFSFKIHSGGPSELLDNPNSVVLTSETAFKYFGIENALGKTVTIENLVILLSRELWKMSLTTLIFRFLCLHR